MSRHKQTGFILSLLGLLCLVTAAPVSARQPIATLTSATLIGENYYHYVEAQETLIELARHAGVGYGALILANPDIDPWQPSVGAEVLVPRAAIVPDQARPGITINLAERRLYLIREGNSEAPIRAYPIGIGREGSDTPTGQYQVINLIAGPNWTPPANTRTERPELPAVVPPGPENPLGDYWIGLSADNIGLHGTNRPYGIGRQVSSGCIRLYPEHIHVLFHRAHIGMPVTIIDQPIKLGQKDGHLYLEAHPDPDSRVAAPLTEVMRQRDLVAPDVQLDWHKVRQVLAARTGVPHPVSAPAVPAGH
ncbi:MAG: L,D-transpeptidase family protein [Pelovirga sp.]